MAEKEQSKQVALDAAAAAGMTAFESQLTCWRGRQ